MRDGRVWAAATFLMACGFLAPSHAGAQTVEFISPADPDGFIASTNANDNYEFGRGIAFQMTADTTINSVGIYQDFTNIQINYNIAEVLSPTGFVTVGQSILRSGGALVSTTGLEFIDFSFANLLLESGKSYHINFQFTGNSNQNFFRDEPFPPGWTQGAFSGLDATEGGHTDNAAIAGIHVNIVPEPIFASVAAVGAVTLAMSRRR